MGNLTPVAKNTEPIVTKIVMSDYVVDVDPGAKFGPDRIKRFCPPICAKLPTKLT